MKQLSAKEAAKALGCSDRTFRRRKAGWGLVGTPDPEDQRRIWFAVADVQAVAKRRAPMLAKRGEK